MPKIWKLTKRRAVGSKLSFESKQAGSSGSVGIAGVRTAISHLSTHTSDLKLGRSLLSDQCLVQTRLNRIRPRQPTGRVPPQVLERVQDRASSPSVLGVAGHERCPARSSSVVVTVRSVHPFDDLGAARPPRARADHAMGGLIRQRAICRKRMSTPEISGRSATTT